jgi:hypothetical protein
MGKLQRLYVVSEACHEKALKHFLFPPEFTVTVYSDINKDIYLNSVYGGTKTILSLAQLFNIYVAVNHSENVFNQ